MSTLLASLVVMAVAAAVGTGGFLLVSRYVPERWLIADSGAAGAMYATVSMVYAIFIAIGAIAVWEPHAEAGQYTRQEAHDLSEAYWWAGHLDATSGAQVRSLITAYGQSAVRQEWPRLRADRTGDPATEARFDELRAAAVAVRTSDEQQEKAAQNVLDRLESAADARRIRLSAAADGMPPLLWPALVLGGAVGIGFLYLFGLARTFPNGLMIATVTAMTALSLFILYQLEFPFSRALSVGPEPLTAMLTTLGAS
ncbi:Protein of unknown function [Micromonospora pallida]|uniref:DUF4239 domain-containing protein n=1 Tax=Micromonospora pallida TaxID=145854 RepID=A0A1C6RX90_9ACTN|nr:DUF4239 domain-containing protein [Micromonospora pallida]SCL21839.1 Protein of unknown function [Micromonospora pallida]